MANRRVTERAAFHGDISNLKQGSSSLDKFVKNLKILIEEEKNDELAEQLESTEQHRETEFNAMLTQINDVHALGLQAGQNLLLTESFYWDMNDGTRAFAARFAREMRGQHPGMIHAGGYSAAMHYLKAAASLGVAAARADGAAAIRRMKEIPTNDPLFGPGQVRADGRKIHPMHLFLVKSPGDSRGPWDYFKLLRSLPAGQSFRPMAEGSCALAR